MKLTGRLRHSRTHRAAVVARRRNVRVTVEIDMHRVPLGFHGKWLSWLPRAYRCLSRDSIDYGRLERIVVEMPSGAQLTVPDGGWARVIA